MYYLEIKQIILICFISISIGFMSCAYLINEYIIIQNIVCNLAQKDKYLSVFNN